MSKPVVLTFVGSYLPGYKAGGPIRTIANLVDRLHDQFEFLIVTDDRDHGDGRPYEGVRLDEWSSLENAEVYYVSRVAQTMRGFVRLIRRTPHDVVYLNSLFSPRFTLLPLIIRRLGLTPRKPVVLAPRGELGAGALGLKSVKKRAFLLVAGLVGLYRGLLWQASSDPEAQRIMTVMRVARDHIYVAPDLPTSPLGRMVDKRASTDDSLNILFLARIVRIKNLDFALQVLRQVNVPVEFVICGAREDAAYWLECERLMRHVPSNVRIRYEGDIPHNRVQEVFSSADLFFLPTRGENFGHAIVEALGAGVPVLISDQTPWSDVADFGAGWALPLANPSSFKEVIETMSGETPEMRREREEYAFAYADSTAKSVEAEAANVDMFRVASR